ncbi:cytochrome c oxidase assembly factor 3 homolog, mitochondrial isoform X2 [Notolabrus celidotus]|uniref:cytochrome c oxidase assembly factor 3 homolog, mitochondrial isoform X2 n=1 Tax=Notolabrus celidotus TaxID=1203425 RepID=UPI00148F450A|nr:cytochrome c oxidase assembly factor 3 homolog, mitochondrial isoform X2 [Notolabrus celidotus]
MADKTPKEPSAPVATRIDPMKEGLSQEQIHFIRQVELQQWKKKTQKLRARNVVTGLAIGALVLGICILVLRSSVITRRLHILLSLPGADYG